MFRKTAKNRMLCVDKQQNDSQAIFNRPVPPPVTKERAETEGRAEEPAGDSTSIKREDVSIWLGIALPLEV